MEGEDGERKRIVGWRDTYHMKGGRERERKREREREMEWIIHIEGVRERGKA